MHYGLYLVQFDVGFLYFQAFDNSILPELLTELIFLLLGFFCSKAFVN